MQTLVDKLRRETFLTEFAALDLLAGPIPYSSVFGLRAGHATVGEFASYMEQTRTMQLSKQEGYDCQRGHAIDCRLTPFTDPALYVFDSRVLTAELAGTFDLPG